MPARRASCENGFVSVAGRLRRLHKHPARTSTNPIFARVLLTAVYGPFSPQMRFNSTSTTPPVLCNSDPTCPVRRFQLAEVVYQQQLTAQDCLNRGGRSSSKRPVSPDKRLPNEHKCTICTHTASYTAFAMASSLAPGVSKCSAASLQPACLPKDPTHLDHSRIIA